MFVPKHVKYEIIKHCHCSCVFLEKYIVTVENIPMGSIIIEIRKKTCSFHCIIIHAKSLY